MEMCAAGGLKGNFTNHSGKITCATQMYFSGMNKLVSRTCQRSEKAVRKYKRSSDEIQEKVSSVLSAMLRKVYEFFHVSFRKMCISPAPLFVRFYEILVFQ